MDPVGLAGPVASLPTATTGARVTAALQTATISNDGRSQTPGRSRTPAAPRPRPLPDPGRGHSRRCCCRCRWPSSPRSSRSGRSGRAGSRSACPSRCTAARPRRDASLTHRKRGHGSTIRRSITRVTELPAAAEAVLWGYVFVAALGSGHQTSSIQTPTFVPRIGTQPGDGLTQAPLRIHYHAKSNVSRSETVILVSRWPINKT